MAVRTARARVGGLKQVLRVAGTTTADRFALLLAPTMPGTRTGRHSLEFSLTLEQVVKPGALVRKGDTVAEFDRQYMLRRLDDYRAWVAQRESNVKRLKALLTVTRTNYAQQTVRARARVEKAALDLKKIPILSDIRAERTRLDHEEAVARYKEVTEQAENFLVSESSYINVYEIELRQTRMEFDRAQRNVDRMVVKAPLDGIVVMLSTHRNHENVQLQQGDQVGFGEPYMRIVDRSSMVVAASINQVDGQHVRVGMPATVHFDAYPDLELPAEVTAVGAFTRARGWRSNYVRDISVRLRIDKLDPRVIPDLSVSADLVVDSVDKAVVVPRECVFSDGQENYTWVQGETGWEKRPVETGLTSNVEVAVRNGLHGGETLAAEMPH